MPAPGLPPNLHLHPAHPRAAALRDLSAVQNRGLLWQQLARSAHILREILELGQAVLQAQHGLLIVNVKTGREGKRRDGRRVDIDQAHMRVPVHHVATAEQTPLPVAPLRLAELPDVLCPAGDLHDIWLPERSRGHRTGGPAATGLAVAVGGGRRISADDNLNRAAKAFALKKSSRSGSLDLSYFFYPLQLYYLV